MANEGVLGEFVDTQKSILTNFTDSVTYTQLFNLTVDIDSNVTKHQLTDDTIDNVFSLSMNSIQGTMKLTTPELSVLVALTIEANGVRPTKEWRLVPTNYSGALITTTFNAQLKTLRVIDSGIGALDLFFRLEADQLAVVT